MSQKQGLSLDAWHERYQQQAQWTQEIRRYLFSRGKRQTDEKILEVGSGTGAVLEELINQGAYALVGIDIDRSSLRYAQRHNHGVNLAQADGYHLPFIDHTFTICYCHFLLLWTQNPLNILAEMRRVTRPGGCVMALAEPDHQARIDFPPPMDQLGTYQTQALKAQGADVKIGRKLNMLFHQVGLVNVETGILGAQWKASDSQQMNQMEWMTIRADLADQLPEDALLAYQEADQQFWEQGNRVLFVPTFYAVGRVL